MALAPAAVIATLQDFRLRKLLDPRPLQIHIVGVDVDSFGLEIYHEVVSTLATEVGKSNIQVSYEIVPQRLIIMQEVRSSPG